METDDYLSGCFACEQQGGLALPPRDHLVPRMPNHPEDARGPKVFAYLADDQVRWLPTTERDRIALAVRAALEGRTSKLAGNP